MCFSNIFLGLLGQNDEILYKMEVIDNKKIDKAVAANNNNRIDMSWDHLYTLIEHFLGGNDNDSDKLMKTVSPTTKKNIISSKVTTKELNEHPFFKISGKTYTYHPTFLDKYENVFMSKIKHNISTHPALANNHSNIVKIIARNASSVYPASQITLVKYKANDLKAVARHNTGHPVVYIINNNGISKKIAENGRLSYPTLVNKYTVLKIIAKNDSSTQSTNTVHNITLKRVARNDNNLTLYAHVHNNTSKRIARSSNLTYSNMTVNSINVTQCFPQTDASTVSTRIIIQNQTDQNVKIPKSPNVVELSLHLGVDGCCISVIFVLLLISMSK